MTGQRVTRTMEIDNQNNRNIQRTEKRVTRAIEIDIQNNRNREQKRE